ncbi:MAG TPA: Gfo/Idh/MocA family oxidoreductase [Bryobacteraceae bacterium]|nr:Gfo/Idh/MocA family oxidoreductase [Bryobacteraceae bacterium]
MHPEISRRGFLKATTAASAAPAARVLGANDQVNIGIIGTGGRGKYLGRRLQAVGGARILAVSDVYDVRRSEAAAQLGSQVRQFVDYRELLDQKDIDAVVIATLDNTHAPITIDACNAGKDVYIEKPMVHKPVDGVAVVRAARANRRIVQVGVNQRSGPHYVEAKQKIIDTGMLGHIGLVRTWIDGNSGYTFAVPPGMENKPAGLDWDRYLGPLPRIPWDPNKYFSPFKYWDFGGGQIMGIMIHMLDNVHWYLGLEKPAAVVAAGGIYHFDDGRDTPDVVTVSLEYAQRLVITWESEILVTGIREFPTAGMEFHGTGGVLTVYRERGQNLFGYMFVPNPRQSSHGQMAGPFYPTEADPHLRNWLDCIRSRQKPVADEVSGHYTSVACYMANQAWRGKTRVQWNPAWDVS